MVFFVFTSFLALVTLFKSTKDVNREVSVTKGDVNFALLRMPCFNILWCSENRHGKASPHLVTNIAQDVYQNKFYLYKKVPGRKLLILCINGQSNWRGRSPLCLFLLNGCGVYSWLFSENTWILLVRLNGLCIYITTS